MTTNLANEIWNVADLLRGEFKPSEYGRVILPFALLRRLECVLDPTREAVLKRYGQVKKSSMDLDLILPKVAKASFYNTSSYSLSTLGGTNTRANLEDYLSQFSANARVVFEQFDFSKWIDKLDDENLLYLVVQKFADFELHPDKVSNYEMGLAFEHLIYKFAETANEDAGDHYTPRDVVRLTTTLVFEPEHEVMTGDGVVRAVYDPTCGTGGFLSSAIELIGEWSQDARIIPYGQELNPESYAICVADMLIKGYDTNNIKRGNTLSDDQLATERFNYCLANPPFGVEWKKVQKKVKDEHKDKGYDGRFGPGVPRVSDGALLFLMHLLSKRMPQKDGGTRIGIILNGSPLFTGGAGSGESEIRRWILENDWLETIVALPTDMFYNTGIQTYIWILSNKKPEERKGLVQLVQASDKWESMRKSLGSKRKFINDEQIAQIAREVEDFKETESCKIFKASDFGYRRVTIERPQRDEDGKVVLGTRGKQKGSPQPDSSLRDFENVPLDEDVTTYFEREVKPHLPDAWIGDKRDDKDGEIGVVGYEINFNRYFYKYESPRPLEEIDADLEAVEAEIQALLEEVTE
jgi:type I restriction enzyme M protein